MVTFKAMHFVYTFYFILYAHTYSYYLIHSEKQRLISNDKQIYGNKAEGKHKTKPFIFQSSIKMNAINFKESQ